MMVKITNPRIFHGNRMQKSDENKSGRSLRQFNEICRFRKIFQKYPCEPGISLVDARRLFWQSRDTYHHSKSADCIRALPWPHPHRAQEPNLTQILKGMIVYRPVKSRVSKSSCVARSLVWVCVHPQLTGSTYANAAHQVTVVPSLERTTHFRQQPPEDEDSTGMGTHTDSILLQIGIA